MDDMKIRRLLIENIYLKGIITGIQMMNPNIGQGPIPGIPMLEFEDETESSAETAQLSAPVPEAPAPEPEKPKPTVHLTYQTAEERYPWPPWTYESLSPERQANWRLMNSRKRGTGPIMRDENGTVDKLCPGCLLFKNIDTQWTKNRVTKDKLSIYCKPCDALLTRVYKDRKRYRAGLPESARVLRASKNHRRYNLDIKTAVCSECHIEKNIRQFNQISFSDGHKVHNTMCLECKEKQDKRALQEVIKENVLALVRE